MRDKYIKIAGTAFLKVLIVIVATNLFYVLLGAVLSIPYQRPFIGEVGFFFVPFVFFLIKSLRGNREKQ